MWCTEVAAGAWLVCLRNWNRYGSQIGVFLELNLSLDVMTFSFGTRTTRMLVSIVIAIISKASTHNIRLRSLRSGNNPNRDRGPGGEG